MAAAKYGGFLFSSLFSYETARYYHRRSPKPPDGPTLFKQQCATCHTTNLSDPIRQGPSLFNIIGRRAGAAEGFHYSAGFAKADFVWDEARIDAWITNPQEMIAGAVMAYRQAKPEIRTAIIAYLKELH